MTKNKKLRKIDVPTLDEQNLVEDVHFLRKLATTR